ncbi:hypothetical protein KI387_031362, partial [Taxus chinensis]
NRKDIYMIAAVVFSKSRSMAMECIGEGVQAMCVVGISILSCVILWHLFHGNNKGAAPPSWPVVGMLPSLFVHLHHIYEWSTQMIIDCGGTLDVKTPWIGHMFSLFTIDPKNIEYIVKTKFANFPRGAYFNSVSADLLGHGILNVDGQEWVEARKMMSSVFHSQAFKNHFIHTLDELMKCRLMPAAEAACESGLTVDLQRLLVRFTFEHICVLGFGCETHDFESGEMEEVAKALEEAEEATLRRLTVPSTVWKAARMLCVGSEAKLSQSLHVIREFVDAIVSLRRKEMAAGGGALPRRHDLLSKLMRMERNTSTDKELRDTCISAVLAGKDTSSVALSWFFWLLFHHPAVHHNILLEIRGIMQRSSGENKCEFTVEEVKEMQYLHAALTESLRLYPSLPLNMKEVKEDEELPDGRRLKKGTSLIFSIYGMGRAESIWGSDCRDFKPERWMREGVFVEESNAGRYPVFNAGPRVCLGKDFAYLQMKWAAALLLYRYRMEVVNDVEIEPKLG